MNRVKKREIDIGISNAIEASFNYGEKTYRIWLGGNVSIGLRSELGTALCSKQFNDGTFPDFSVCWLYEPKTDEWWISFRGEPSRSPDLSVIAKSFGGGGHSMASGMSIKSSIRGLRELFIY